MIRKKGSKFIVYSHDGSKVLGTYNTRKEAEERLKQVEMMKHIEEAKKKGKK